MPFPRVSDSLYSPYPFFLKQANAAFLSSLIFDQIAVMTMVPLPPTQGAIVVEGQFNVLHVPQKEQLLRIPAVRSERSEGPVSALMHFGTASRTSSE